MVFEELKNNKYDIHFVRYEDLVAHKKNTLMLMSSFILDLDDTKGTNAEFRCQDVTDAGFSATATYKVKSTTGTFNAHEHMFTEEQKKIVHEELKEFNYIFGYANAPEGHESFTEFFHYDDVSEDMK